MLLDSNSKDWVPEEMLMLHLITNLKELTLVKDILKQIQWLQRQWEISKLAT